MAVNQISVFLENKPGTLCEMTGVLAKAGVNMRALSLAETKDMGIARIIVDDVIGAGTVLRDNDFLFNNIEVVGAMIPDEPGGLNKLLNILSNEEVNVEYMYAFLGKNKDNHAYMIIRVEDCVKAESALNKNGINTITQEYITEL